MWRRPGHTAAPPRARTYLHIEAHQLLRQQHALPQAAASSLLDPRVTMSPRARLSGLIRPCWRLRICAAALPWHQRLPPPCALRRLAQPAAADPHVRRPPGLWAGGGGRRGAQTLPLPLQALPLLRAGRRRSTRPRSCTAPRQVAKQQRLHLLAQPLGQRLRA